MDYTQYVRDHFSKDRYALELTGVKIEKAEPGYCLCSMEIGERHLNNNDDVMGGALFTLADYAFGCAANLDQPTVTLTSTISFMRATRGPVVYAEAKRQKTGRNVSFYSIDITDSSGKLIANMQASGFSPQKPDAKGGA